MRRADRQVTDIDEIKGILDECRVCRMAMYDGVQSYLVPLNFGYELGDTLTLYFHSAKEGRKLDNIKAGHTQVCIEMDCGHSLIEGNIACAYGYAYASLIGNGKAELVEASQEKRKALECLMRHQTGQDFQIDDNMASAVAVIKVTVSDYTAKRHG